MPTDQCVNREGMPEIVNARAERRTGSDTRGAHQLAELLREVGVDHRRAFAGDKEGRPRRLRHEPIAQRRVRGEGIDCGRGEGELSALVELRGPHDGHTVDPVDVGLHKRDGLAHAHAGGGQQADHRLEGRCSQRCGDELRNRGHQVDNVGFRVDERRSPPLSVRHQPGRRDLCRWVEARHVPGEAPHGGHSPHPHRTRRVGVGTLHPCQGSLDGDRRGAGGVQMGHEVGQKATGVGQLVTQCPAQTQVVLEVSGEDAHAVVPGQPAATLRSATRSTFA